jgi:hypothetical protein
MKSTTTVEPNSPSATFATARSTWTTSPSTSSGSVTSRHDVDPTASKAASPSPFMLLTSAAEPPPL